MPRVTRVAKCQKDYGKCGRCRTPLPKGSAIRWWKFFRGGRNVRCMEDACSPSRSDLTNSHHLSGLYAAVDGVELNLESPTAIAETCRDLAETLRDECAGGYRESFDAMQDAFPNGCPTMELCEENAEQLEGYADEVEQAGDEIDNLAEAAGDGDPEDCEHCDGNGYVEDEDEEQNDCPECGGSGHLEVDEDPQANEALIEEAREVAQAAIDNCPL